MATEIGRSLEEIDVKVKGLNIHGLRHTNISVQLTSNLIPEKEVSARAGHGSTKVTKDIYWELFKDDGKRAAMSIDFLFG